MNNRIRFGNDADYKKTWQTIKAKFTQLMDVGVREFGIWPMMLQAQLVATIATTA